MSSVNDDSSLFSRFGGEINNEVVNDFNQNIIDAFKSGDTPLISGLLNSLDPEELGDNIWIIAKNSDGKEIMLRKDFLEELGNLLTPDTTGDQAEKGSDAILEFVAGNVVDIRLVQIRPTKDNNNATPGFMPYVSRMFNVDLVERYQIWNSQQVAQHIKKGLEVIADNCVIHALIRSTKVSEAMIANVKLACNNSKNISRMWMKKISEMIDMHLVIHTISNRGYQVVESTYPSKCTTACRKKSPATHIDIAIHSGHAFLWEETEFTKMSLLHYDDVNNHTNWYDLSKANRGDFGYNFYFSDKVRKISSLKMVHTMREEGLLIKGDLSIFSKSASAPLSRDVIYLNKIKDECRPVKIKNIYCQQEDRVFFADTETYNNGPTMSLFLLGWCGVNSGKEVKIADVNECLDYKLSNGFRVSSERSAVYQMLRDITNGGEDDAVIYFHNLKFDFAILKPYLNIVTGKSILRKGGTLYSVRCRHHNAIVTLKDSYKLLSMSLKNIGISFNDDSANKMEGIAYDYYTKENYGELITRERYEKHLPKDEIEAFRSNLSEFPAYKDSELFDPVQYYKLYLKLDCVTLRDGLMRFREVMKEATDGIIDCFNYLTISSIADSYMRMMGAYDGVCELGGNIKRYVQKSAIGGRVTVNPKFLKKEIEGPLCDLDAVSLYPSAMVRICNEGGLPTGEPTRFTFTELNDVNCYKDKIFSVMTVEITKVGRSQQIPALCYRDTKGGKVVSIHWTNDMVGKKVVLNNIMLDNIVDLHDVKFILRDGVYWNDGVNNKMGEIVENLFKLRLKYKKTKPALATVIKLLLNSIYGKTMTKPNYEEVIVKAEKWEFDKQEKIPLYNSKKLIDNYIAKWSNTIKSFTKISQYKYEIVKSCADFSYNMVHIASMILSMSKLMMNDVLDIFDANDFDVYYTDTDSMHCRLNDLSKVETIYNKIHPQELLGKQMGQFHGDFDLKGVIDSDSIISIGAIFLGKKSYIHKLKGIGPNGEEIKGVHYRMKGVTTEGMVHKAKDYADGMWGLYKALAANEMLTIVLNPMDEDNNKKKFMIDYTNDGIKIKDEFKRTLFYGTNEQKKNIIHHGLLFPINSVEKITLDDSLFDDDDSFSMIRFSQELPEEPKSVQTKLLISNMVPNSLTSNPFWKSNTIPNKFDPEIFFGSSSIEDSDEDSDEDVTSYLRKHSM